jgi:hypothetical protein
MGAPETKVYIKPTLRVGELDAEKRHGNQWKVAADSFHVRDLLVLAKYYESN